MLTNQEPPLLIVIGLTGGIASGKSYVAARLAERGAVVLDADKHARAALEEPRVRDAVLARWGEGVADNRKEIARLVFGDSPEAQANRRFLEGLVHPIVRARLQEELDAARESGAPAAVLDIPLLHEAGWAEECDAVIFVETPTVVREARAARRGWNEEELARREATQKPIDEKKALADQVVPGYDENSADEAIAEVWGRLVGFRAEEK